MGLVCISLGEAGVLAVTARGNRGSKADQGEVSCSAKCTCINRYVIVFLLHDTTGLEYYAHVFQPIMLIFCFIFKS